jgi:hypothetical protein
MTIILFQPFDIAKWGLIGFNAFLAFMAEGGVSLNNPIPQQNRNETYHSLPDALHAFKQVTTWAGELPASPWFKLYVCFAGAYLAIWLVLNWVGCRGEFVFLDNIVRNRAALKAPWQRYARQGNIWFLFHIGLVVLTFLFAAAGAGAFLFLNWSWINAERDPTGMEIGTIAISSLVLFALGLVGLVIMFLIRSLVLPLYFMQTMSLGTALLTVMTLTFTRPISVLIYVLLNIAIGILAFFIVCSVTLVTFCATCCLILSVSCFPIIGSLLVNMLICQLILPLLVFMRCFQLGCLEQFGPQYEVFNVDLPPMS